MGHFCLIVEALGRIDMNRTRLSGSGSKTRNAVGRGGGGVLLAVLLCAVTSNAVERMTLDQCLEKAFENNRRRPASRFAVAAAEAQHRQTLAGYWPHFVGTGGFQRMDEPPNFLFPASQMYIPPQSVNVPGGTAMVTVPAGVLGPAAVQLPVEFPGQTIQTDSQAYPVPAQSVKLMDRDSFLGAVSATWLLFDGGMRRGLREQAAGGVDAARQEAKRTDLELTDSVKRMYYGSVVARQLHQVGLDTLARMEATLSLTETMYQEGSGRVKRTDFLENRSTVETLRGVVAQLEKNEAMARAALANTMGLPWRESVTPADDEVPYTPSPLNLEELVDKAYQFNPDWKSLEAGLSAAGGAVRHARSGYYPKIAVRGELRRWWNEYDAGIATSRNKDSWSAGIGLEWPLFEGFLTQNRVRETLSRKGRLEEQQLLLREGIGLMIKDVILSLAAAARTCQATGKALESATENCDLNTRAYRDELVETEKVIRAQLMQALMTAQHLRARYDHLALQSRLNLVVGTEVWKQLGGGG